MADRSDADVQAPTIAADGTSTTPQAGSVFAGRYLIERLLGRGGMGAVWAAVDRSLGERVALKVLDVAAARDAGAIERFRREVRLARRVTHPNVARIYDIGELGGIFYLTMELVDGTSLAERIDHERRLSPARAVDIARQIADGLAAAHEAGVVHRDLKPANVLLDRTSERVVLTDFGIAYGLADDARITKEGGMLGTPAYMAPEQVGGGTIDARTDLYALGLVIYEATTGTLPFEGESSLQLAVARLDRPPIDPRKHVPLPDALAELVLRCLRRDPAQRPASAQELARLLASIDAGTTTTGPTPPSRATSVPTTRAPARPTLSSIDDAATLAVLPLRYHGPAEDAYIADTLTDELVDLLSATRGLKVMASGATAKYAGVRDPFEVGRELGIDVVVDGTVQRSGGALRISARLIDVASGFQTWTGRFDGELEDVFELQDRMARKIAETLRVQLETERNRGDAPAEAIDLYLRARAMTRRLASRGVALDQVLSMYDQCLALAPGFRPALAGRATASLRGWFRPAPGEDPRGPERVAREAVAAAVEGAPDLAETQLALARLAVQDGRFPEAAAAVTEALRLAPTYAEAHEYAGSLMCEAGQPARGMKHLRLAHELDPGAGLGLLVLARHSALEGDRAEAERWLEVVRSHPAVTVLGVRATAVRIAAWFGDDARVRELASDPATLADGGPLFVALQQAYLGDEGEGTLAFASLEAALAGANPRFRAMIYQFSTEAACRRGRHELGWDSLQRAATDVLFDLHWLDRCPLLEPLRARPDFQPLRDIVRRRAETIWQMSIAERGA